MKNIRGFTLIEGLLILVIAGVLGGTGWYVWNAKKNTNKNLNTAAQTEIKAAAQKDLTTGWTAYSSTKGQFSLKYPNTWVQPTNKEFCSADLFDRAIYLGPDKNSVLKCGSEFFGQIYVNSTDGDKRSDYQFTSQYKSIDKKDVMVSGIKGQRISATASGQEGGGLGSLFDGTAVVKYIFYVNSKTYLCYYEQVPAGQGHVPDKDVLTDFDLMVTKTLKFSSS